MQGIILSSPVTIIYHYQPTELVGLNLNPAHIFLDWPTLIAAAQQAKQPTTNLIIATRDDPTARTLTALSPVFGPGPFSLFADPQNQGDPSPHVAEMQGNNGQVTYSYPLQVAPGTGGFAPQLALNYSSTDPNDRHSATSPAGDEGDGWSLGLGSITMETYPTTPTATNWYFINGVDNVSDRLIEYDTTNKLFYTEHLSYLRIQQVTTNGQSCFDVWDKSGTFYELGCTKDSLEYSVSGSTTYDYQWNVDRIVAPNQGPKASAYRMILATYLQYCNPTSTNQPCPATSTVRDSVLQQITYGSATSVTASTLSSIAGTIDFTYHAPFSYTSNNVAWATAYGNNYNCSSAPPDNQTTTLRCDDPIQRSGGFTPPDVMSTFSLDRITSYIGPDRGTGSYPAYAYTFSYTDTPFYGISCIDPILLADGYCAGEHTLSSITPHIYLQGTDHARKSTSFSYATSINSYYDSLDQVRSGNPPTYFQNSTLWNYLTSYFDLNTGIGESISYETAYSNTDGTPTIKVNGSVADDRFDALYCTSNAGNSNQSLQCFQGSWLHPNDQAWSVQVVTSITSSGKDDSALSQATTTYAYYRLADTGTYSGSGAWCYPDQYSLENQCVGDNWFASFDGDWGDYYHAEFRGFAQVSVKTPSGDLVNSYYFSTEGWNKPPTDPGDYDAGQVQVQEIYQGGSQNAANLLSETVNTYPGPYDQNGDSHKNPNNDKTACYTPNGSSSYAACDVVILSSATTDYEGQSSGPSVTTSYTYDDYTPGNNQNSGLHPGYHNLIQKQVSTSNSNVPTVTYNWSYSPNDQNAGGWTYYTVDAVTHSETDSGGHIYHCHHRHR